MSKDFNSLVRDWIKYKEELSRLEEKVSQNRTRIEEYMKKKGISTCQVDEYKVSCRNMSRSMINKNDIPSDLWNKYSHKCEYTALSYTRIKDKDDIWSV